MRKIELSPKQIEFLSNMNHRWCGKIGATQCGKTYIDVTHVIPERLLEREGKPGLSVIFGVTKETIERNVLEPMRDFWGEQYVSSINSRNIAVLFGQRVYCLGAEKANQVSKIRGAKFKYVYIDELVEQNEVVFNLIKSRLSLEYSVCDFTGNPSYPTHYVKAFIDSDADVYCQNWTIYDNPFITCSYVDNLEKEYAGTVYFDRYILGQWALAEGVIYRKFADDPDAFTANEVDANELLYVSVGLDYGAGGKGKTVFVAVGISKMYKAVYILDEYILDKTDSPEAVYEAFGQFYRRLKDTYNHVTVLYGDWGGLGGVINDGLRIYARRNKYAVNIRDAEKGKLVIDRINLMLSLFSNNRIIVLKRCERTIQALKLSVWSDKKNDTRLDNQDLTADLNDALEYAIYPYRDNLKWGGVADVRK